jgi:hypothetical protein
MLQLSHTGIRPHAGVATARVRQPIPATCTGFHRSAGTWSPQWELP